MRASTRSATWSSARATPARGSATTIGRPVSPPSTTRGSSGIWPSSGTFTSSASACPPPEPNTAIGLPVSGFSR
jgi:hypothetical protein